MNDSTALEKLAESLIDRVDALEKENAALVKKAAEAEQQLAMTKAAAANAAGPVVSEAVVDATVDALVKAGSLNEDQRAEGKRILMEDMEAPHRVLQKLLYDGVQVKTATVSSDENIRGGMLVDATPVTPDAREACLARMTALLRMD